MYGPDVTFLGVERCDLARPSTLEGADVVIIGAPYDAGTSYRAGARFDLSWRSCHRRGHIERLDRTIGQHLYPSPVRQSFDCNTRPAHFSWLYVQR